MSKQFKQNKYNAGDIVCAKVNPTLKLIIRRYVGQIYYCKIQEDPERKELVYFERELVEDPLLEAENKKARN
jgi:hypothetical protein